MGAYPKINDIFVVTINILLYLAEDWEKRKISPFYKKFENEEIEIA